MHDSEPLAERDPVEATRREFLSMVSVICGAAIAAIIAVPCVGFLLSPLIRRAPRLWRSVGPVNNFQVGQTVEVSFLDSSPLAWAGVTAKTAAWLRRETETEFIAFSVNCTHLGCPVRWLPHADLFMCPCHGGVYYKDGQVAAGPPPHPLVRYPVQVYNGEVRILTSPIPTV